MARHRSLDRLARGIVASVLSVAAGGCDTDDGLQFGPTALAATRSATRAS